MLALVLADSVVVVQVEPELGLCLNWYWLPEAVVLNCADEVVTLLWLNSEVMGAEQVAAVVVVNVLVADQSLHTLLVQRRLVW
jgi:hypothetical protein